jgi:hypothetical protein
MWRCSTTVEHLTHHFWLTDDGATLCKPCGARYRASAAEVIAMRSTGILAFMERHRACGSAIPKPKPQKVQIQYTVRPNPPKNMSMEEVRPIHEAVDPITDLAAHYARACKGDKTRALLMALDAGYDFTRVVGAFGDEGVQLSFQCLLKGWIDQGQITDAGRAELQRGADA